MFLLLDKPKGRTSFDCIRKLQRLYGKKIYDRNVKIGHAGTLDPMATGLLIIAIGNSTKQLSTLIGLDKTYTATIDISVMSDTRDNDEWSWKKKIVDTNGSNNVQLNPQDAAKRGYDLQTKRTIPSESQIQDVLQSFISRKEFLLTPFSAKKIEGKKLYEYARTGNPILKSSPMNVINARLLKYVFPFVTVQFEVGSGTYIRSLGFELGKALGRGGILTELRRESVGCYKI